MSEMDEKLGDYLMEGVAADGNATLEQEQARGEVSGLAALQLLLATLSFASAHSLAKILSADRTHQSQG
jgi:hypothetical protein